MQSFIGYRCSVCGKTYEQDELTYTCPNDGGNVDVILDYDRIKNTSSPGKIAASRDFSIWRYLDLLPVADPGHTGTPLWAVGWTPVFDLSVKAAEFGLKRLWLKDDGRNPTASFKDRASAVVVARAQQTGVEVTITASTGNAGAALAGMAAAASHPAVILAPKTAPPAKVAQLMIFGARVFLVDGNYDDAFDLSVEAANALGWYCRNTGYNPFTAEGKKTAAFEICEQLSGMVGQALQSNWYVPDAVFVSVGDGNIISGLHKGFKELSSLGWIERVPRIYGIQSEGSAAIANAYRAGTEEIKPVAADTLADSISVDLPRDGLRALRAATETGGAYLAVSDQAILDAMVELGKDVAVFAEPAGSTAYAGMKVAIEQGLIGANDEVLVMNTGSGLKDVGASMQATGKAPVIEPLLSALQSALEA
ncbi:MAG: threonine synthase [Anaerolineales bacterium]|nr:threonine synthase [Anaerolineales bacterium]